MPGQERPRKGSSGRLKIARKNRWIFASTLVEMLGNRYARQCYRLTEISDRFGIHSRIEKHVDSHSETCADYQRPATSCWDDNRREVRWIGIGFIIPFFSIAMTSR